MLRDHQWHPPPMLTTLMMHQPDHRQGGISGAAPQNAYIMTRRSHSGGRPNKNADLPVAAVGLAKIWVRFQIVAGGLKTSRLPVDVGTTIRIDNFFPINHIPCTCTEVFRFDGTESVDGKCV